MTVDSYPEKWLDCKKRAVLFQSNMYWDIRNNKFTKKGESNQKKVAILCFSHGAVMKHFTEIIDTKMGETPSYCSFSAMSVVKRKMKTEFRNFDSHLSDELQQAEIDTTGMDAEALENA
jgi:hypothetical protein